jgi:tetratricopeptide (TPR) repeat protein
MHKVRRAALLLIIVAVAGCASFQVAGDVQTGRRALIMKDPETALAYLVRAAEKDPNYIYSSANFRESVWTYVGRSQYALGRYDEARRSLERALSVYRDDAMAQIYLGLTWLRSGDLAQGLKVLQLGLKALYDWIEYLNRLSPSTAFWDPSGNIRKEIDKTLAMTSGERVESLNSIIENAEWIGQQFRREFDRDGRKGIGFGLGIGW